MRLDKNYGPQNLKEGGCWTSRGGDMGRRSFSLNLSLWAAGGRLPTEAGVASGSGWPCMQLFSFPCRFFRIGNHSCYERH